MRTRSSLSDPQVFTTASQERYATTRNGLSSAAWYHPSAANGSSYRQDSKVMTDQKTPGYFKARRENGVIPCSPMDSVKTEEIWSPGVSHFIRKWSKNSWFETKCTGYFWPALQQWPALPAFPTVDGEVALQEALARAQTDCYDSLTMAAEFRKTVEGVITLHTRAQTLWSRFEERVRSSSRSKRYRGMAMAEILSSIWLELRYMWRPLAYDMQGAYEAYRRLTEGMESPLQRAYATREGSNSTTRIVSTPSVAYRDGASGGLHSHAVISSQVATVTRTVHASVGLKVTTRDVHMTDPFVTGWELIPFSFVFDWFVTMGDMLAAFSPFATGQLMYATLATEDVSIIRCTNVPTLQSGSTAIEQIAAVPCIQQKTVINYRRVLASPVPTLAIDVNLNMAKVLDLIALVVSLKAKSITRLLRYF